MKLMYDEEILYKVMTDQVLPNVFKEIYSIPNHLILAVIQKINNVSFNQLIIISLNLKICRELPWKMVFSVWR